MKDLQIHNDEKRKLQGILNFREKKKQHSRSLWCFLKEQDDEDISLRSEGRNFFGNQSNNFNKDE